MTPGIAAEALRGIGEHEFVCFFNGVAVCGQNVSGIHLPDRWASALAAMASTAAFAPNGWEQRQPAFISIMAPGRANAVIKVDDEFLAAAAGTHDDQGPRAPALDQR